MTFIVATNVVARRLPERQLTGTPTVCANCARYRSTGVINVRTLLQMLTKLSRSIPRGLKIMNGMEGKEDNYLLLS